MQDARRGSLQEGPQTLSGKHLLDPSRSDKLRGRGGVAVRGFGGSEGEIRTEGGMDWDGEGVAAALAVLLVQRGDKTSRKDLQCE